MARGKARGRSLGWAVVVALGLVLASMLLAAARAAPALPAAPVGTWLTQDRGGVIAIEPCGGGGAALCGRIVGLTGRQPDGSLPTDVHGRTQCGLVIITGAAPGSGARWEGRITNPESGRTYDAQLWLDAAGQLHLRGYLALPLFGATQVWTPFRGAVPRDCRMVDGTAASGGLPTAGG